MNLLELTRYVPLTERISLYRVKPMKVCDDGKYMQEYGNDLLCTAPIGAIPMKYAASKIESIQSGDGELIVFVER